MRAGRLRAGSLRQALAALALAACIALPVAAKEFRSADIHPADYPTVRAVEHLGERLRERTQGRHSLKVFAAGALGSEKDILEQTKLGALAMARVNSAALNNIVPETVVPTLPFLFRSVEHLRAVLDGPIGDEILAACEKQGYVGLAFYDSGERSLYTVKKPVRTLADAKGLKIRVPPSDLWVAMLGAMGANATPMPLGEVYTALRTGLVDGAENNWSSYESSRHFEAARYYSLTEHSMAPEMLLFSKRLWDQLTPEDQKIIRETARESVPYMRKLWDEREARARKAVEAAGAQVIEVDRASFEAAMTPVYDRFAADPVAKDLVRRIRETR